VGGRVSATSGTIFHGTRPPLTVWLAAAWMLVSQKQGISALDLKRTLGIGSEQTAWAMLHRYRTAMVRPGRDRLTGVVEVDETFFGGPEPTEGWVGRVRGSCSAGAPTARAGAERRRSIAAAPRGAAVEGDRRPAGRLDEDRTRVAVGP
jgi:hypothetical protein